MMRAGLNPLGLETSFHPHPSHSFWAVHTKIPFLSRHGDFSLPTPSLQVSISKHQGCLFSFQLPAASLDQQSKLVIWMYGVTRVQDVQTPQPGARFNNVKNAERKDHRFSVHTAVDHYYSFLPGVSACPEARHWLQWRGSILHSLC